MIIETMDAERRAASTVEPVECVCGCFKMMLHINAIACARERESRVVVQM